MNKRSQIMTALMLYGSLSFIYFGLPFVGHITTRIFGVPSDPYVEAFYMAYTPYMLSHGINPIYNHFDWAPLGLNMSHENFSPGPAILLWLITTWLGPVASYNILMLISPVAAALAAYLLCHEITKKYFPSLVGGYIYGFSTYMLGQLTGHSALVVVFPIPLLALISIKLFNNTISKPAFIISATSLLILLFSGSIEIFATATMFAGLSLLFSLFFFDKTKIFYLIKLISVSFGLSLLLLGYYLYNYIISAHDFPGTPNSPVYFSADIMNFLIPTPITRIGRSVFSFIASKFTGNYAEDGVYIGAPLMFILMAYHCSHKEKSSYLLKSILWISLILSLGPYLHVAGTMTGIPLPGLIIAHTPLLKAALPIRFSQYMFLALGVITAIWLANNSSLWKYMVSIVALIFLVPNSSFGQHNNYWSNDVYSPKLFSAENIKTVIQKNRILLIPPVGGNGYAQLWQAQSNFYFRMIGNYLGTMPTSQQKINGSFFELLSGQGPAVGEDLFENYMNAFCSVNNVFGVVVTKITPDNINNYMRLTDWKRKSIGSATIYYVPREENIAYYDVNGDVFPPITDKYNWFGKSIAIHTHHECAKLYLAGKWIPGAVGAITIAIRSDKAETSYKIGNNTTASIMLPKNGVATLTANKTWIPNQYNHSGDTRNLSVLYKIEPRASCSEPK